MNDDKTLSDEELFMGKDDATPEAEAQPEAVPEQVPEPELTADPEAKAEETPEEPDPEAEGDKSAGLVPSWRLREQSEAARAAAKEREEALQAKTQAEARAAALEQQLQAFQHERNQQPVPDQWQDPEGFEAYRQQQLTTQFQTLQRQIAETQAYSRFGYDTVKEAMEAALAAAQRDPQLDAQIASAPNPWAAAVEWNKRRKVLEEVGEDPKAYKERMRQELMAELKADPEYQKQLLEDMRLRAGGSPSPQTTNINKTFPSLNGAASSRQGTEDRMLSDEELFLSN